MVFACRIRLNAEVVNWSAQDLSYLVKDKYDSMLEAEVRQHEWLWEKLIAMCSWAVSFISNSPQPYN